jgi:hypothetical protein
VTVAWIDAPGSVLASKEDAIDFSVTADPAPPVQSVVSVLQPLNYAANIVAAYALNEPAAPCNLDRSGNGRHFTGSRLASDLANAPDLIPDKACVWAPGPYALAPKQARQEGAHWALYGELTVAHRVWVSAPEELTERCFGQLQGTPPGTANVACQWGTLYKAATPSLLYYYAETAAKASILFVSTLQCLVNTWQFITVRRRADNSVRLGLNTVYEDSGPLPAPGAVVADPRYFVVGAHQDDTALICGGMADLIIWNRFLTDAELIPQHEASMRGVL